MPMPTDPYRVYSNGGTYLATRDDFGHPDARVRLYRPGDEELAPAITFGSAVAATRGHSAFLPVRPSAVPARLAELLAAIPSED